MDVALLKAHELGYDEHKPRLKEARVNISMVIKTRVCMTINSIKIFFFQMPIKEEYLEPPSNHQVQSRNRSSPSESSNLQSPNVN
jgi:hypothetical protein